MEQRLEDTHVTVLEIAMRNIPVAQENPFFETEIEFSVLRLFFTDLFRKSLA